VYSQCTKGRLALLIILVLNMFFLSLGLSCILGLCLFALSNKTDLLIKKKEKIQGILTSSMVALIW
jgi:hypothetical protein